MSKLEETKLVNDARSLSPLFSVDIVIKIFGVTIWEMHFPPKK